MSYALVYKNMICFTLIVGIFHVLSIIIVNYNKYTQYNNFYLIIIIVINYI